MKAVSAAFVKAQKAFGPALKTSTNPHFKSRYADLAACVEAVIDALNANGIALMQRTHPDDTGVTVETILLHESGEQISSGTLHVPAAKADPQGYGSALTYARRYSLMAACGIAPEDDDGNAASKKPPARGTGHTGREIGESTLGGLDEDSQNYVRKVAAQVTAAMPDGARACELLELAGLENDAKVALWGLLDSATRSAIKRAKEAQTA